jgi:hypothetical protein
LGDRRDWPRRRAAEQRDELAPFQPIKLHVVTAGPTRPPSHYPQGGFLASISTPPHPVRDKLGRRVSA